MYQNMPGANRATIAHLSRTGPSVKNLETLHYDLAKLAGINPQLFNRVMAQPVTPAPEAEQAPAAPAAPAAEATPVAIETLTYQQQKAKVKELGLAVADQKQATIVAALEAYNATFEEKKS
jgi:hypothetical protein